MHNYQSEVIVKNLGNIKEYVENILGMDFYLSDDGRSRKLLVPPLNHFFNVCKCSIQGMTVLLLWPLGETEKLSLLIKRVKMVEQKTGLPCILVLLSVDSMTRRQLIKNRINFIVPKRQLYIPILGTYLTERKMSITPEISKLSPSASAVLIYHLCKADITGLSMAQIAALLGYRAKTITVAADELDKVGLCRIVPMSGKTKTLTFDNDKKELWKKAQEYLQSPIKEVRYIESEMGILDMPYSYDTALGHYTDVTDRGQNCKAVYYRHNAVSEILKVSSSTDFPGSERIEIWKYDPARLAKDGYVDPLSLALCYKDDSDERVQGEIKRLIERTL